LLERGRIAAVLDIDSKELNTFDETDKNYLEEVSPEFPVEAQFLRIHIYRRLDLCAAISGLDFLNH